MKKNKIMKHAAAFLSVLLAVCVGFVALVQLFAQAIEEQVYVEDIKFYITDTGRRDVAKKWFEKQGFVMSNIELNPGTDTGKDVWLGYKTTTNRDMAITDIKLMPMQGGYQIYGYNEVVNYISAQQAGTAQTLSNAAAAFKKSYEAGSPRALDAYEALNLYHVPDSNNDPLGDYLLGGKGTTDFFAKVLVRSSANTIGTVMNFLGCGLSPYQNEYDETTGEQKTSPWASLIAQSELWQKYAEGLTADEENALNKQYQDTAKELFKEIQRFTTLYQNAAARSGEGYENIDDDIGIRDFDDAVEKIDEVDQEDTDVSYLVAYELLNQFQLNETTRVGDWFVALGLTTSDAIDLKLLYPIIEAMGEEQAALAATGGLLTACNNLIENERSNEFAQQIEKVRNELKTFEGMESLDLFLNSDVEMTNKRFAYTSEAVRKSAAESTFVDALGEWDKKVDKISYYEKLVGMIYGAVYVVVGSLYTISTIVVAVSGYFMASCAVAASINAAFVAIAGWLAIANTAVSFCGIAMLGFTLTFLAIQLIRPLVIKKDKSKYHTEKPDYFIDTIENGSGTMNIRYKCALDDEGEVADINASEQWKWVAVSYTRDQRIGSPIVADKDGNIFKNVNGNPNDLNGYSSASYFGERSAADFNAYCEDNSVNGCYLHYRTEESIALEKPAAENTPAPSDPAESGTTPTPSNPAESETPPAPSSPADGGQQPAQEEKSYLADIVMGIGSNATEARNKITAHKGKYYIYDTNLSPRTDNVTYIGYAMTTEKTDAITDLRVAPYSGNTQEITYGDVKYIFVDILGFAVGKGSEQGVPQADGLYYTKDPKAGSPIPADSLHIVNKLTDFQPGWEPISFFGNDLPYNFDTAYESYANDYDFVGFNSPRVGTISNYHSDDDHDLNSKKSFYIFYEPEERYTGGAKYLSGFFFAGGYDTINSKWVHGEVEHDVKEFRAKLDTYPRCYGYKTDLAYAVGDRTYNSNFEDTQLHIYFTWSYNPKRAITDIAVYEGDNFTDSLPYTISKPTATGASRQFVSVTNLQQQYTAGGSDVARFPAPGNMFRHYDTLIQVDSGYRDHFMDSYTKTLPDYFTFGYTKTHFLPVSLYVSGCTANEEPLLLSDVVFTEEIAATTEKDGQVWHLIDKPALEDYAAGKTEAEQGVYHPVVDFKNPHSETPYNLSYPDTWDEDDEFRRHTKPVYIYIRGPQRERRQYISSLSVGSYSRKQYRLSASNVSDEMLEQVDKAIEQQAMLGAIQNCQDEIVPMNLAIDKQSNAWYKKQSDGFGSKSAPENKTAAYIGVTRTSNPDKAITAVLLYQIDDYVAPNKLTVDGVDYTCAGVSSPIEMKGKNYFLYYTYNTGVSPGHPIEEITISDEALIAGASTNLCYDKTVKLPYGNPDQSNFIHMHYTAGADGFFNKLYIGKGVTRKEALCDLLSQECVDCMDIDLNNNAKGDCVILGFRRDFLDLEAIAAKSTEAAQEKELLKQTNEAVYDVIATNGEAFHPEGVVSNGIYYEPVSDVSLNSGNNGYEVYLYYASPYFSAQYNKKNNTNSRLPQDAFSGYISHLALMTDDRVPYNTSQEGKQEGKTSKGFNILDFIADGVSNAMENLTGGRTTGVWEYVMLKDDAGHLNTNAGAVNLSGSTPLDCRLTMFAQRYDGSVKPAGEITGGFVDAVYDYGELWFK